jgi:hypothetical protein
VTRPAEALDGPHGAAGAILGGIHRRDARPQKDKASFCYIQLEVEIMPGKIIRQPDSYTFAEMQHALVVGWGELGARVAQYWLDYNELYFAGKLQPLPIFLVPTAPYGYRLGWTCCQKAITHIALTVPGLGTKLVANRSTLLHEMVHQHCHEQGLNVRHAGEPWRKEIMRIHLQITGTKIWAGRYYVGKQKNGDGSFHSKRMNRADPESGQASISQFQISRWPYSLGINLGAL